MQRKTKRLRPYFGLGNRIQVKPINRLMGNYLEGLHGTITRIEEHPHPDFFPVETQEDYEEFLRIRSVDFWIRLDDFPELDDYYKQNEILCYYRELRPLPSRMGKQQLAQYCEERCLKEQRGYRQDTYLGVVRYLNGQWPGWPLSSLKDQFVPKGYYVDLINRFINGAREIRKLAQEIRERNQPSELAEKYDAEAEVCDEIYHLLMPKQRFLDSSPARV